VEVLGVECLRPLVDELPDLGFVTGFVILHCHRALLVECEASASLALYRLRMQALRRYSHRSRRTHQPAVL
jgi:hypothetical protein